MPDDVAIVGFDEIWAAQLAGLPLTTVAQNPRRAGEALAGTLTARIEERDADSASLPVKLIVRGSS